MSLDIVGSSQTHDIAVLKIGDRFQNVEHLRNALRAFAIKRKFDFTFIKNDRERVTARCAQADCNWRVHASREGNLHTFRIKTLQPTHVCGGGIGTSSYPKASKKWVCDHVIQKLKDRPLYRAVDIQWDILREHGVGLPYKQAWMGKEVARTVLYGSEVQSYDLLLWYVEKVMETNPGSVATIESDGGRFRRGFFCFRACVVGFKLGCRPLLFVDGTHLLGKYGGILLGATGKDGNEGFFHVAFAIVDNETDDNWTWFLTTLRNTIYGDEDYNKCITFISDRSKGLVNAIARVFPSSSHAYCLRHLEANFMKGNTSLGKALKEECWALFTRIAYACTSKEFDDAVKDLLATSAQAHRWLIQKSDVAHWSNYLFKGQRWGEMYPNVAESFNAWIKEARHLPVTEMVDIIRYKLMNMMYARREHVRRWGTHLCPAIHRNLEDTIESSRLLRVGRSDGEQFEVIDPVATLAVNLQTKTCSCRRWQVYGIPCMHACASIVTSEASVYRFVDNYFTVQMYANAYANHISPVPGHDKPTNPSRVLQIRPLITKRKPGRPRRTRIESQALDVRELRCSRCKNTGHNRRTCNAVIAD
ncbi:hypothetical protein J5N97_030019 [Dioscorea zingiberensis]|uniref:SWIM-type domain-containing protein n=1 Tax=Dioscorea zingiberensis TaxID=325984 RepID=A0A9D5H3V7_9LILI|nr:hypothetical protein J5N97_030019 [Dioscorea zingiberensis]